MRMSMKKYLSILLTSALVIGCQPGPMGVLNNGSIVLAVKFPKTFKTQLIKPETKMIQAVVYGSKVSIAKPIKSQPITPGSPRVVIKVPTGRQTVLAAAYDNNNQILTAGKAQTEVKGHTQLVVELEENFRSKFTTQELKLLEKQVTVPVTSTSPKTPAGFNVPPTIELQPDLSSSQPTSTTFEEQLPNRKISLRPELGELKSKTTSSPVRGLKINTQQAKAILSWEDEEFKSAIGYNVFINGKKIPSSGKITRSKSQRFEFELPDLSKTENTLAVSAVRQLNGESAQVTIQYSTAGLEIITPDKSLSATLGSQIPFKVAVLNSAQAISTIEFHSDKPLLDAKNLPYKLTLSSENKLVEKGNLGIVIDTTHMTSGNYAIRAIGKDSNGKVVMESSPIHLDLYSSSGTSSVVVNPYITNITSVNGYTDVTHRITINGDNFTEGLKVFIGTTSLTDITIGSSSITATIPAGVDKGTYAITLNSGGKTVATSANSIQLNKRWFVDLNAAGDNSGNTWTNANPELQNALAGATSGDEIWVAKGTYKPTQGADRTVSFTIQDGIKLFGGLANGELELSTRNLTANQTILSGDLTGNDNPAALNFTGHGENSLHVVKVPLTMTAALDGFTITGGNANQANPDHRGGGIDNLGNLTLKNMTFKANQAGSGGGGGLYNNLNSQLTISDSSFIENESLGANGGGVISFSGQAQTFRNISFDGNRAQGGGGMMMTALPGFIMNASFEGVTFQNNLGFGDGAGLVLTGVNLGDTASLNNMTFTNNDSALSASSAGGFMINSVANATLSNSSFTNNDAVNGGALWVQNSSPALYALTFNSNTATQNGGAVYLTVTAGNNNLTTFSQSTFTSNTANNAGGAVKNEAIGGGTCQPQYEDVTFNLNQSPTGSAGAMLNDSCNTRLFRTVFTNNTANAHGGALENNGTSLPVITESVFYNNTATNTDGGAIFDGPNAYPAIRNTLIAENTAGGNGGGISHASGAATNFELTNVTIADNNAGNNGGGLYFNSANTTLTNGIINGNTAAGTGNEIMHEIGGRTLLMVNTNINGGYPGAGVVVSGAFVADGNTTSNNPLFVNPADADGPDNVFRTADDGFQLQAGSLSVDDGAVNQSIDILGISRPIGGGPSRGAYER